MADGKDARDIETSAEGPDSARQVDKTQDNEAIDREMHDALFGNSRFGRQFGD